MYYYLRLLYHLAFSNHHYPHRKHTSIQKNITRLGYKSLATELHDYPFGRPRSFSLILLIIEQKCAFREPASVSRKRSKRSRIR